MPRSAWVCPACNKEEQPTRHHIMPKRHFGKGKRNKGGTVKVCRKCHDNIERKIPQRKMPASFYYNILVVFGIFIDLT